MRLPVIVAHFIEEKQTMSSATVSDLLQSRLSEFKDLIAQPLPENHDDMVALFRRHRASLLDRADGPSTEELGSPANLPHLIGFVDEIAAEIRRVSEAAKVKESASCDAAGVTGL